VELHFQTVWEQVEGRCVLTRHVSHLMKRETRANYACLASQAKGEARYGGASPFYFTCTKMTANIIFSMGSSLRQHAMVPIGTNTCIFVATTPCGPGARSTAWSTSCLRSSTPLTVVDLKASEHDL
jgi:hypothetical protein